jgi:3-hydroxyisobutyrate dehydrogenase
MKIAWLGTGIMGAPMARHIALGGYEVHVYNRTYEKALKLQDVAFVHESLGIWISDMDVIFTMLGYPKDVEEVTKEVFKYAKKDTIIIDMTTSDPRIAIKLYELGQKLGLHLLDAPVTGSQDGAIHQTLSIMVGGEHEIFNQMMPIFSLLGKTITYIGKAGNGQLTKLSNQLAIAGALSGVVEAFYFATLKGLDLEKVYQVLNGGSAQSQQLKINGLKMIQKNYEPGFYVKHFLKDLRLAKESLGKSLHIANKVIHMLETLVEKGYENLGTQSLILYYLDSLVTIE